MLQLPLRKYFDYFTLSLLLLTVTLVGATSFSCDKPNPDKTTDTDTEIVTLFVNSELVVYTIFVYFLSIKRDEGLFNVRNQIENVLGADRKTDC